MELGIPPDDIIFNLILVQENVRPAMLIQTINYSKTIIKNILEYILSNQQAIENEMNYKNRIDKKINKINKNIKLKKNKLSIYNKTLQYTADNNYITNNNNNISVVVSFN
jgi:hypothetical protein